MGGQCKATQVGDEHSQHDHYTIYYKFKKIGRHRIVRKVPPAQ